MSLALQPSFSVELSCPSKVVLQRLFARLDGGPHQLRRTRSFGGAGETAVPEQDHFVLTVAEAEQRSWSPWLNVEVAPQGGGALLHGRFSPHPSVWTLVVFSYMALTVLFLFSLCFAAAQRLSGAPPWALCGTAATALGMIGLWGGAQLGQRLAREQMAALRAELDGAVEACAADDGAGRPG